MYIYRSVATGILVYIYIYLYLYIYIYILVIPLELVALVTTLYIYIYIYIYIYKIVAMLVYEAHLLNDPLQCYVVLSVVTTDLLIQYTTTTITLHILHLTDLEHH